MPDGPLPEAGHKRIGRPSGEVAVYAWARERTTR
jgi:hypothetical protein